jgi:hypothetical protein
MESSEVPRFAHSLTASEAVNFYEKEKGINNTSKELHQ